VSFNVAALLALAALDLNNNNFSGHIPASLSCLRSLAELDLGSNWFDRPIPAQLGNLSGLINLRLYNNNLVGHIPHHLTRLPRIQHFDLGSNYLTNPSGYRGFSPMPTIKIMSLYLNYLDGGFPEFVLNSGNITYLYLSQNIISGNIPDSLPVKLPNLMHLNLSVNALSGQILASLSTLRKHQD
jgi:Leucine-rich repeat (LRR) protein